MARFIRSPYANLSPRARKILRAQIEAWTPENILEHIHAKSGTLTFHDNKTMLTGLGGAPDSFHIALGMHLPTLKSMIQGGQ